MLKEQAYKVASILKFPREFLHFHNIREIQSSKESILFFTTYKCASSFAPVFFELLNNAYLKRTYLNYASFVYNYNGDFVYEFLAKKKEVFKDKGYLYAPLRRYIPIKNLDQYKIILMLRDPRDILVSHYFSAVHSHPVPKNPDKRKRFLITRNKYKNTSVDKFVIDQLDLYYKIFTDYKYLMDENDHVLFVKYEELINDFDLWYQKIANYLEIPIEEGIVQQIKKIGGFDTKIIGEHTFKHIRKRKPGDFKEKLETETITKIEERFEDLLLYFSY